MPGVWVCRPPPWGGERSSPVAPLGSVSHGAHSHSEWWALVSPKRKKCKSKLQLLTWRRPGKATFRGQSLANAAATTAMHLWPRWKNRDRVYPSTKSIQRSGQSMGNNCFQESRCQPLKDSDPWKTGSQQAWWLSRLPSLREFPVHKSGRETPGGARHTPGVEEAAQRLQEVKVARIHQMESWRLGESRTLIMCGIYRGPPAYPAEYWCVWGNSWGWTKNHLRGFIWKNGRDRIAKKNFQKKYKVKGLISTYIVKVSLIKAVPYWHKERIETPKIDPCIYGQHTLKDIQGKLIQCKSIIFSTNSAYPCAKTFFSINTLYYI